MSDMSDDDPLYMMLSEPVKEWCDKCALPSRVRYPTTYLDNSGVSTYDGGGLSVCESCAERDKDKEPDPA